MHFEILVEDQSGKVALDILVPKIIGKNHTFDVKSYKGIGHIPAKMNLKKSVEFYSAKNIQHKLDKVFPIIACI